MYADLQSRLGTNYVVCVPSKDNVADDPPCSDNTVLYLFSSMQYLVTCLCLSMGKPFRKAFYYNPYFLVSVVIMIVYQIYSIIRQDAWNMHAFALLPLPTNYKNWMLIMVAANSICSYLFEKLVIGTFTRFWNNKYKKLSRRRQIDIIQKDVGLVSGLTGTPNLSQDL